MLGRRLIYAAVFLRFLLPAAAFPGQGQNAQSIHNWVSCSGKDESAGVAAAFNAARNGAFTLVVDCPVVIHTGMDVTRPIFIDSGTTVQFTGAGLFTVDNVLVPAFVLANSRDVRLFDWKVQYVGGLPMSFDTGGYYRNGTFVSLAGHDKPGGVFNDDTLTHWLSAHRGIQFQGVASPWAGPTNTSSVFFLLGATSNVDVERMSLFAPQNAPGSRFIPMAFSASEGYKDGQTVTKSTPANSQFLAVPSNLRFIDVGLDGYYMGWQGPFQNALFTNIIGRRYGDLQDDGGGTVGGSNKWFAPPHLFYINFVPAHTGLEARNLTITNVTDYGIRVGTARDKNQGDTGSGNALSLKIGALDSEVNGYVSNRPDGFLDVLTSKNLIIHNVKATYDSSFLNDIYPGIRFPNGPYVNVVLDNITVIDQAPVTKYTPVASTANASNAGIEIRHLTVRMNQWQNSASSLCPSIKGARNIEIRFEQANGAPVNCQSNSTN